MINADGDVANETGLPSWATWLKVFGGVSLALVALVLGSLFAGCMADSREPCTRRWGHLLDRVTTILSLLAGVFLFAWSVVGWIMHFNYSSASIPSCSPAFEAAWAISSIIMWLGMGIGVFLAACGICRKED
jgi:MFS family permease